MIERRRLASAARALSALLCMGHALALRTEWQHEVAPGVDLRAGLQAGFAAITMVNANLGLGRVNALTGVHSGDPTWAENFIKPILGVSTDTGLFGEVSLVGATTYFDGDPVATIAALEKVAFVMANGRVHKAP